MGKQNPYNSGWRDNQTPRWNQKATQGTQQAQQPRKPSPLEEALNQFIKMSQTNFESI
ncbi:hypothetical protein A2U01_0076151, partial [Trifolium medium]|nr:hypothetical protein [Trifolium medium]